MPKEFDLYRGWYSSSEGSSYRENGCEVSTPPTKIPSPPLAETGPQPSSTLGENPTATIDDGARGTLVPGPNGKVRDEDESSSDYHVSSEYESRNAELQAFYGLDDIMNDANVVKNQQTIITDEEEPLLPGLVNHQTAAAASTTTTTKRSAYSSESANLSTPLSLHVDEPCTAMSVSPSGRDVVLASRRGIYIIDLHDPFSPPRWLNHLTSWEVADVQWSPHASKPTCIVSTSNQKAIVWNVGLPSYCAVEHVLHGHERAITDINFHAFDPERLATCSVDTFVHCWDLRATKSPVISFSDFRAAATQVKWNRCNEHIVASCHDKFVRIWDDRMGARPVYSFEAHKTKITGLDFNRFNQDKFITCSIDKTIKFWNISKNQTYNNSHEDSLLRTIHTTFPVTKARHTPFGDGCLVIPEQDFDNAVCLIDNESNEKDGPLIPIHIFRGHQSQVKEALWRYSGGKTDYDDRKFQLITWSKDHDLRLWPIDDSLTRAVHHVPGSKIENRLTRRGAAYVSYRREPKLQYATSATNSRALRGGERTTSPTSSKFMTGPSQMRLGINHLNWMAGVRVGRSAFAQNVQSESMDSPLSINSQDRSMSSSQYHHPSQPLGDRDFVPENLGEEVSSIGHKFPRITFEKISISTGSCVVCLHGPWGPDGEQGDLIFMRVAISFPPQYPSRGYAPTFSIESNAELGQEKINEITNELNQMSKAFTDHGKFCLEPCLRLLLGERVDTDQLSFPSEIDDQADQSVTTEVANNIDDGDIPDDGSSRLAPDSEDDTESRRILSQLPGLSGGMYSSSESSEEDVGAADDVVVTNDFKVRSKITSSSHPQVYDSTPLPRLCGGCWTLTGKLVCFFPAQQYTATPSGGNKPSSVVANNRRLLDPHGSNAARFEAFGRFRGSHGIHKKGGSERSPRDIGTASDDADIDNDVDDDDDDDDDFDDYDETTDSSDEIFQQGKRMLPFRFNGNIRLLNQPLLGGSKARSTDLSESHLSYARSSAAAGVLQKRNHVTIRDYGDTLLNLHFDLAKEYMIPCGSGRLRLSKAALHNSRVCARYKLDDLSYSWQIIRIILSEDKDDNPIELNQKSFNNLIWGGHPMGSFWMVPKLFDYFSSRGDVQMLGMMACFFSEAMAATSDSTIRNRRRATAKFNDKYSSGGDYRATLSIFSGNMNRKMGSAIDISSSSRGSVRGRTTNTTSCRSDVSESGWKTARRRRSSNNHGLSLSSKPVSNAASVSTLSQDDLIEQQQQQQQQQQPAVSTPTAISSLSGLLSTSPERLSVGSKRPYQSRSLIGINGNINNGDYSQQQQLQIPAWQAMQSNNSSGNISTMWQQQQHQRWHGSSPDTASPKPGGQVPKYKGVNLMLINQDLYDYGLGAPLLTNRMYAVDETSGRKDQGVHLRILKYKYCRKNYADILDAWALNVQRAEVCSFDSEELEANLYETHGRSASRQHQHQRVHHHHIHQVPVVEIGMRCSECGLELENNDYDQQSEYDDEIIDNESIGDILPQRCPKCHKINKWLVCVLCKCPIKGLYSPCLSCEHAVHTQCGREWFISNKQQECPLGCGCNCIQEVNRYEFL